ncbi:MAG: phenylalanine--tRNA ligase beta subunit-related protein [Rhodothermales bacterium]
MIEIHHRGPESLLLGAVAADGVRATAPHSALEERLETLLQQRRSPLDAADDAFRMRVRDVFRNGRYKPTGRGKPASEYLLRTAEEGTFPRINTLVDICNAVSLAHVVPISILDLDRAAGLTSIADSGAAMPAPLSVMVRLGAPGESYVFNSAGQEIDLEDLIAGCVGDVPVVNAVKDSMATKTTPDTRRVLALLYAPAGPSEASLTNPANPTDIVNPHPERLRLEAACTEFARLLEGTCEGARATWAILAPDGTGRPSPAYLSP